MGGGEGPSLVNEHGPTRVAEVVRGVGAQELERELPRPVTGHRLPATHDLGLGLPGRLVRLPATLLLGFTAIVEMVRDMCQGLQRFRHRMNTWHQ